MVDFKDITFNRIWIYDTPLFGLHISFKNRFYNLCFNKYSINSEKEINLCLDLTYHEEILDLYLMFQNIAKSNGSLLFQNREDTSYDLINFINNTVEEIEHYDEEEYFEYDYEIE